MFLCSDDNDTKCSKLLRASLSGTSGMCFHEFVNLDMNLAGYDNYYRTMQPSDLLIRNERRPEEGTHHKFAAFQSAAFTPSRSTCSENIQHCQYLHSVNTGNTFIVSTLAIPS